MNEKEWRVPLASCGGKIRIEHNLTSGRRSIWLDEKLVFEDKWRLSFTGDDEFKIGAEKYSAKLIITYGYSNEKKGFFDSIFGGSNANLEYNLVIDGLAVKDFIRNQERNLRAWDPFSTNDKVFLDTRTIQVWFKGQEVESAQNFVDYGSETTFCINNRAFAIQSINFESDQIETYEPRFILRLEV